MTNAEAYELATRWTVDDDRSPHLRHPWVQDMGGAQCMVASDGAAAVWVRIDDHTEPGRYTAPGRLAPPDPEIPDPPDLYRAIPPSLWGFDLTDAMRAARTLALTVPRSELHASRACDRAVVGVLPIGALAILHRRKLQNGPMLRPARCWLSAEYVARLPEIVTATQYQGPYGPIVMTHGDDVGSILMPRRSAT